MNREVFQPIGIRWLPSMRLRVTNAEFGPPPLGWGLLLNPHDIVRISASLQADGAFEGQQLLHRERTRQLLRKNGEGAWATSSSTQLQTGSWVPTTYREATWSAPVRTGGSCKKTAARMDGLGGNFVVMMPSGITAFRIADANIYDSGALILTSERIRSSCP
jgi:hypothetical protein